MEPTYLSWSQSGLYQESIRSLPGVHTLYQESIRSPPGVHQEYQDFIRTPDGVHQDSWGSVTYRLMDIVSFTGRCHPTVKEEPKSLVQPPQKQKAYSTTDASSIRCIKILGSDINTAQPSGKHHKSTSGTSSQVQFDGIMVPPGPTTPTTRAARKSMCTAKANSKKDMRELFERLGQEFHTTAKANEAAAKTCEDIAELCD